MNLKDRVEAYIGFADGPNRPSHKINTEERGRLMELLSALRRETPEGNSDLEAQFERILEQIRGRIQGNLHRTRALAENFAGKRVQTAKGPGIATNTSQEGDTVRVTVTHDYGGIGLFHVTSVTLASELSGEDLRNFQLQETFWTTLKEKYSPAACLANPDEYKRFVESVIHSDTVQSKIAEHATKLAVQAPKIIDPKKEIEEELRILLAPEKKSKMGTFLKKTREIAARKWTPQDHDLPTFVIKYGAQAIEFFIEEAKSNALSKQLRREKGV
jgi:hypothetical protein